MLAMLSITVYSPPVYAGESNFSQKILPLDCVFETVDAGTGTLRYITPAECGQIIPVPSDVLGTGNGVLGGAEQPGAIKGSTPNSSASHQLPALADWSPIASTGSTDLAGRLDLTSDTSKVSMVVVSLIAVAVLAIALIL